MGGGTPTKKAQSFLGSGLSAIETRNGIASRPIDYGFISSRLIDCCSAEIEDCSAAISSASGCHA
jgi:hypothetical protein